MRIGAPGNVHENVDGLDAQDGVRAAGLDGGVDLEVDVVDADDFAAMNVDDLLIKEIAPRTRVPAGHALTVDRDLFAAEVTRALEADMW